ncbi:hypothetical protein QBC45DRAFT_44584 [Copromyces sp. CBS 386.78]|nr:hypothetical protein QBC45DRAFT_44584 [Copromyces sp. CBS 386.78]
MRERKYSTLKWVAALWDRKSMDMGLPLVDSGWTWFLACLALGSLCLLLRLIWGSLLFFLSLAFITCFNTLTIMNVLMRSYRLEHHQVFT